MPSAAASAPAWHPAALAARYANLAYRSRIQAAFRGWFGAAGFAEVETPSLQVSPGLEVHLIAFATELKGPYAGEARQLYLHTSPEFAMKKLLAGGMERIFQFARVWRNGERSPTHHPEFTMLEWYRTGATYEALMDDCVALVRAAFTTAGRRVAERAGKGRGGMTCDVFAPWERLSVADAFTRHTGIDVLATAPDPWAPDVALLAEAARKAGIVPHDADTWEDLFFRILLERIEPHLGEGAPTILCDYPVSMAALSRPSPRDGRVAERFELYVSGVELANAFSELTDPAEQRRRFEADMDMKEKLYGERYPIDEDFLAAVAAMPACAGIALGFDRLVMLATGAERLEDVLWLPVAPVA